MESKCTNCGKPLNKKPDYRSKTGNIFCNNSCAAQFSNKIAIKRPRTKKCKKCKKAILSKLTYCDVCYKVKHYISDKTLAEAVSRKKYNDANRYSSIRGNARNVYAANNLPRQCKCCGYKKHIEICHKKDISSFPPETLISEINSIENLVALCRNHHWELDHNELSSKDKAKLFSSPGRI